MVEAAHVLDALRRYPGLINLVLFQAAWFACVLGAAAGNMWVGPLAVFLVVPLQVILFSRSPDREATFMILSGVAGFFAETMMTWAAVHSPARGAMPWPVSPLWMVALWVNFASAFSLSLSWLKGRYFLAAFMGFWAGPLAFYAGERMEAIVIHADLVRGYGAVALVWATAVPGLLLLHDRLVLRSRR